jgi:hypothetical protein
VTGGSRVTFPTGMAVVEASKKVVDVQGDRRQEGR